MAHDSLDIEDISLEEADIVSAGQLSTGQQWEVAIVVGGVIVVIVAL